MSGVGRLRLLTPARTLGPFIAGRNCGSAGRSAVGHLLNWKCFLRNNLTQAFTASAS
jgi:hypothetical protein